jgi:hypothetical protein
MKTVAVSKRFIGFAALIVVFVLMFFRASGTGLNWLIYGVVAAIVSIVVAEPEHRKHMIVPATGLALCSVAVFVYANPLAIITWLLSFGYLGVAMVIPKVDPGFGAVAGFLNFIISPFGVIIRFFQRLNANNGKFRGVVTTLLIPGALLTFFSILYYQSSPAFKELLDNISWYYLPQFIITTIVGLFVGSVLLYCFAPTRFNAVYDNIGNKSSSVSDYMGNKKFVNSWLIGIWSLVLLLLVVVVSDFNYIFNGKLPQDFTYTQYLHQGVYTSIFSIICSAVLTILTTNYLGDERKKSFTLANLIFIGLNGLFVWQNVIRNHMYVTDYGLTSKRLIIYIYLALCLTGLILTIVTIVKNKSLGFLYKANAFNVYAVLIISALMNWSTTITSYNLAHPYGPEKKIDYQYLLSLDNSNTYLLSPYTAKMNDFQQDDMLYRAIRVDDYSVRDYREWVLKRTISKRRLESISPNTKD